METLTKKEAMYQRIENHGDDLNRIFNTGIEPVALCKKLHRLEVKANLLATNWCNGDIEEHDYNIQSNDILVKVGSILGLIKDGIPIYPLFFNGDCRGYTLKLDDSYVKDNNIQIHRDWGGYGIIAPDLS